MQMERTAKYFYTYGSCHIPGKRMAKTMYNGSSKKNNAPKKNSITRCKAYWSSRKENATLSNPGMHNNQYHMALAKKIEDAQQTIPYISSVYAHRGNELPEHRRNTHSTGTLTQEA